MHLLMYVLVVFLGTLNKQLFICKYTEAGQLIGGQNGCYNLVPVFEWIRRCIISIFLVFFIAFLPLFLQGTFRPFISFLLLTVGNQNLPRGAPERH